MGSQFRHEPRFPKPPCDPGRSHFTSPVLTSAPPFVRRRPSRVPSKLKRRHASAPYATGLLAPLVPRPVSSQRSIAVWLQRVSKPPSAQSPFARPLRRSVLSRDAWEGVTPPSSLIRAHAPDPLPPSPSDAPSAPGLCRLLSLPAGRWPFPTLSLHALRRRLDPYPAVSPRCLCPFLPGGRRPLRRGKALGRRTGPMMQLQPGPYFRGCSHSLHFRLRHSLGPQVAPTADTFTSIRAAGPYTPRIPRTVTRSGCGIAT